ncbi:hypothetical protein SH584_11320 [Sphingomonas sp. LY29]|uniref:hypothetical protein n=1 Tax=Sphingomonas sp. LY29 TaxID=3095341 RepID=UPI002D78979C|nr:hypothetical protein [Sphingomonas sp. LY29]WRP25621.1 hypothetical protein SH584_11320 [Sphingomonas sp. LY29]
MTALRYTHRQNDWRKLNISHGNLPQKEHSRAVNGPLLPMDKPTRPNLFTRLFKGGAK